MNTVDIFHKPRDLLSQRKLKSSFSACSKEWVVIEELISAIISAVDIFHGVLGWNPHSCWNAHFCNHPTLCLKNQIVDISESEYSWHFLKRLSLLSQQKLNSSFSAWSKVWVVIEVLTSEMVAAVDVFHGVLGWNHNECWYWPCFHHSTACVRWNYCHQ